MPIYCRAREKRKEVQDVERELVSETEKNGGSSNSKEVNCEYIIFHRVSWTIMGCADLVSLYGVLQYGGAGGISGADAFY